MLLDCDRFEPRTNVAKDTVSVPGKNGLEARSVVAEGLRLEVARFKENRWGIIACKGHGASVYDQQLGTLHVDLNEVRFSARLGHMLIDSSCVDIDETRRPAG